MAPHGPTWPRPRPAPAQRSPSKRLEGRRAIGGDAPPSRVVTCGAHGTPPGARAWRGGEYVGRRLEGGWKAWRGGSTLEGAQTTDVGVHTTRGRLKLLACRTV
eukprot:2151044-Pyramimonas_sp.AAC.1